jgi:transposase
MKVYCGVDLHSNNSVVGIMDETGRRLLKRRVRNQLSLVEGLLEPYREQLAAVVVESTYNWYWLVDGLLEDGYPVRLAHPAGNAPYGGLKHTDDGDDALWLAELARVNSLREGYIYPRALRGVRDLLRQRTRLVRQKTGHVLSIKNIIAREGGRVLRAAQVERLDPETIREVVRDPYARTAVGVLRGLIGELGGQIRTIERTVLSQVRPDPRWQRLKTIWGVGEVLSLVIHLESGEMTRFASVGNYASYARCVDSRRLSNDKLKGQNNKRNGNGYLEWAFVEAGHFAQANYPRAQAFFARKKAQTNAILARKALAAKLCRAAFYVMRDEVNFDPDLLFR